MRARVRCAGCGQLVDEVTATGPYGHVVQCRFCPSCDGYTALPEYRHPSSS